MDSSWCSNLSKISRTAPLVHRFIMRARNKLLMGQKIWKHAALKNSMVFDLSFMNVARFELYWHIQFRVVCNDLIRRFIKTVTPFFNEIGAGSVTYWTGGTFNATEYDFSACICFSAVVSVNAEVASVKEGSFMIPIAYTMERSFYCCQKVSTIIARMYERLNSTHAGVNSIA